MNKFQVGETDIILYFNKDYNIFADHYGHKKVYCDIHKRTQLRLDVGDQWDIPFCWKCIKNYDFTNNDRVPDLTRYIRTNTK